MGRPFIEFLQSQLLEWKRGRYGGGLDGVSSKMLSLDPETGASSLLLEIPAGFVLDVPHHLRVDEEFLVLHGDLRIDGIEHGRYTYAHLPAGWDRQRVSSVGGAVLLAFYSGEPKVHEGTAPQEMLDSTRAVEYVDAFAGEWGGNFNPKFPPGAGRKFLRRDPHDGEETWILGTMPLRWGLRPERHPVVEEMYMLSGDLAGHRGIMRPGAYFWRPPEEWHGPFGSPTGNLMIFRTKGGPLSTVYTEDEVEFSWDPEYDPILPDELSELREARYDGGCACY